MTGIIGDILADYAQTAALETFIATHTPHHSTDIAGLRGSRLVIVPQTEGGKHWAEAKLKTLTGGDRSARLMRQDFFEFTPQFKIVISGNHKPNLRTVDAPASCSFAVTIPEGQRDPHLREKLKIEALQILSLLIKRSLEWQRLGGLTSPAKVREATESYLEEQDSFASWIEEKVRDQRKISFVPCRAVPIVEDICRSCGRVPGSMKDFVSSALEYAKPMRASEIGISSLDGWRVTDGAGFRISKKTAYHNVQMSAADSNHAGVETQIIR